MLTITKKELKRVRTQATAWLEKWKAAGKPTTHYVCPHCDKDIECTQPRAADCGLKGYWDGMKTCTECGAIAFVITRVDGTTEARKLGE